jgi:hypothetical protein
MVDRRLFKGMSMFNVFKERIKLELENIQSFIEEISDYIKKRQSDIEKSYDSAISDFKPDEDEGFDPAFIYDDDIHKYNEVFPKHYFNPLLLSIYGLFENWLKRLCDLDSRRGFSNLKVNDLAGGNYIEKSRKYLKVVAELNLDDTEKDWQKIKQIQKVRNAIAHNDSNIKTDKNRELEKQELYTIIKSDNRIELNDSIGSFYIKDKEYLYEVIELITKYLNFVISNLASRKVVAKNTTMPFNNDGWGQEKTEQIIKGLIQCLDFLDDFNERTDEHRESDFNVNLEGNLGSIMWDATKVYSFFCDGKWDTKDSDIIMKERKEGLEMIKKIYNR